MSTAPRIDIPAAALPEALCSTDVVSVIRDSLTFADQKHMSSVARDLRNPYAPSHVRIKAAAEADTASIARLIDRCKDYIQTLIMAGPSELLRVWESPLAYDACADLRELRLCEAYSGLGSDRFVVASEAALRPLVAALDAGKLAKLVVFWSPRLADGGGDLAALFRAVLTRCPDLRELKLFYGDAPVFRRVLLDVAGSGQRIPPLKANPIPGLEDNAEHVAFMEHLLGKLENVESYELPCGIEAMLRRVRRGLPAAPSLRIKMGLDAVFPDEVFTPGSFAQVEDLAHHMTRLVDHGALFRALATGRIGGGRLKSLFLCGRGEFLEDNMRMLYDAAAPWSSSLRGLESLVINGVSQDTPGGFRYLGRMLGVCPRLREFVLIVTGCPDEGVKALAEGAMEAGAGAAQLEELMLHSISAGLDLAPLAEAIGRGPDGPFSKLRRLSVNGQRRTLASLVGAPADWTATIEELKLFNTDDRLMAEPLATAWPFPELRRVKGTQSFRGRPDAEFFRLLRAALDAQHAEGRRRYRVVVE